MARLALLVSRSGDLTPGLRALVAVEHDPVPTVVTDHPEDGRYHLAPATLERVERWLADADADADGDAGAPTVVVDGDPHPGQLADLRGRLHPATVVDRRRAFWARLAAENPVAATRAELQAARVERRAAAAAQRDAATTGPSGESGRLADADDRVTRLRDELHERRTAARERVLEGHDADARVVLLGRVDAPTTELWATLCDESAPPDTGPGRPARPRTATASVGAHTVAVTDAPGVPGDGGLPTWYTAVVPGLAAALEDAACVLGVGPGHDALLAAAAEQVDALTRSLTAPDAAAARAVLGEVLETATVALRLPYDDDAHALVSWLHDRATVHATEYDDAVYVRAEVACSATDDLRRRVAAVDGELRRLDDG
jgi:hypothetical protein